VLVAESDEAAAREAAELSERASIEILAEVAERRAAATSSINSRRPTAYGRLALALLGCAALAAALAILATRF
jgi:hypothetical protein